MNIVFTPDDFDIDRPTITATLSWRQWVTVRRLKLSWTKADLAERVGCSRTTLWRTIECPSDHERWLPLPVELRHRIEAALASAEAREDAVA